MRWHEFANESLTESLDEAPRGVANTIDAAIQQHWNSQKTPMADDKLAAIAHKQGFRSGFKGSGGDDTRTKPQHREIYQAGYQLGVKTRKKFKGELPPSKISRHGFTKDNPAFVKVMDTVYPGYQPVATESQLEESPIQLDPQGIKIMDALVEYLKKQLEASDEPVSYLGSGGLEDDVAVFFQDFRAGQQHFHQLGLRGAAERAAIRDAFRAKFGVSMTQFADQLSDARPQPLVPPAPKAKRPPRKPMNVQYD